MNMVRPNGTELLSTHKVNLTKPTYSVSYGTTALGTWSAYVKVTGDIVKEETVTWEVFVEAPYQLRVWASDTAFGKENTLYSLNQWNYIGFQLTDTATGKPVSDTELQFHTKFEIIKPDGTCLTLNYDSPDEEASKTYSLTKLVHTGTWTATVTVTGDIELQDTFTLEVSAYSINVWFSRENMGDKATSGNYNEAGYVCYEIIDVSTGERLDDSSLNYTVAMQAVYADGTLWRPSLLIRNDPYASKQLYLQYPGVVTGTVTVTGDISLEATTTWVCLGKEFKWGTDNLVFDNFDKYFTSRYVFDNTVRDGLLKSLSMSSFIGLSNIDRETLKVRQIQQENKKFGGSCYGMTTLEMLCKYGRINTEYFSSYKTPSLMTNSTKTLTAINTLQLLQTTPNYGQPNRRAQVLTMYQNTYTQADIIKAIKNCVKYNQLVNVGISYKISGQSDGLHSIMAYDDATTTYHSNVTGKSYDRRILIADPNTLSVKKLYNDTCIYYDSTDYSWIIPYYTQPINGIQHVCYWNAEDGTSTPNGSIMFALKMNSKGQYVDVISEAAELPFVTRSEVFEPTGVPNDVTPTLGTPCTKTLLPDKEFYFVSDEENYAYMGKETGGSKVRFDFETHGLTLTGSSLNYDMWLVSNAGYCVTDWYKVGVKGKGADSVDYKITDDGYVLTADKLQSIYVYANNDKDSAEATFSTEYKTVLIYEIDASTIGVAADADDDGVFDTDIIGNKYTEEPTEPTAPELPDALPLGDVNGDGLVDAGDAAHILVECALTGSGAPGTYTDAQMAAADADGNGVVDAGDSSFILTYAAACGSNTFKGTLEEYLEQYLAGKAA